MADGALKPEEVIAHRFSVLPYMSGEDKKSSGNILVVVCDCGWIDMTDNEVLGMGWDAATLYRDHIAGLRVVPEDRPAQCPNCGSTDPRKVGIRPASPLMTGDGAYSAAFSEVCSDPWHNAARSQSAVLGRTDG